MNITLTRRQSANDCTIGAITIDGRHICHTLEDVVREVPGQPVEAWKIKGHTAIPRGTYQVAVTISPRFGIELPLLQNVPGFSGIRIHTGNTAAHTEGCIIPGLTAASTSVGQSKAAFDKLFSMIRAAIARGEKVLITIA